jgi:hypothetical protein
MFIADTALTDLSTEPQLVVLAELDGSAWSNETGGSSAGTSGLDQPSDPGAVPDASKGKPGKIDRPIYP